MQTEASVMERPYYTENMVTNDSSAICKGNIICTRVDSELWKRSWRYVKNYLFFF
jgi:hypothetical protein